MNIYHEVNNFCTLDLSSFYLDFAKDILYIEAKDHYERRAMQTVMHESLITLVKLLSPILPHTADEVWSFIPGVHEESVQLTDMPEFKEIDKSNQIEARWSDFLKLRDDVLKALEEARNQKVIGKSLTAKVTLYVNEDTKALLEELHGNMKQLFIVSDFAIGGSIDEAPDTALKLEHGAIVVEKAEGDTCERCWTVTPQVGQDSDHPTLCPRCASVVKENYV